MVVVLLAERGRLGHGALGGGAVHLGLRQLRKVVTNEIGTPDPQLEPQITSLEKES